MAKKDKKDDVICIQKPDPDSHWRLRACPKCSGDNVDYVQYNGRGGAAWRVQCFDCGHAVDKGNKVKHDAQLAWNRAVSMRKETDISMPAAPAAESGLQSEEGM